MKCQSSKLFSFFQQLLKMSFILCCLLVFTCLFGCTRGLERQLRWSQNPGCTDEYCNQTLLIHVTACGPNDTIHYVWGFIGRPTILLAVTELETSLTVNWQDLLFGHPENSIQFDSKPFYTFGVAFNRLLEFRDVNDTANLENVPYEDIVSMDTIDFNWSLDSLYIDEDDSIVLEVRTTGYKSQTFSRAGNISITMSGYGKDGHGSKLPHLLHTSNCSQLEITLQGLETSDNFEGKSRFALEVLFASNEQKGAGTNVSEHRSLDDEHTPGVFTVAELMTPMTRAGNLGAFVQWRPVAYTLPVRDIESSTESRYYKVHNITQPDLTFNNTLIYAYYGFDLDNHLTQAFNISFGVSEDGFYNATSYTTWSLSMGYGQPPEERLSLLVLLIMGIGLGTPAMLLFAGGCYMLFSKRPAKKDDLLLSR